MAIIPHHLIVNPDKARHAPVVDDISLFISDLQPCFKILSRNIVRLDCINIYKEEMSCLYELFDKLDCRFSL
jgi:hypothetical protein